MSTQTALANYSSPSRDREVIRVDMTNDKACIAESLRRAFAAAAHDQCTRDFDKLLAELD